MFRTADLVLIAATLGVVAYTYAVKSDTKSIRSELANVQEQIKSEEQSIAILRADWSLLTNPQRIQSLVEVYADQLDLTEGGAKRFIAIDDIPMRPAPVVPELDIDDLLARIAAQDDPAIATGSISNTILAPNSPNATQNGNARP